MKNWIIYIWFSIGFMGFALSMFDFNNGMALRNTSSDNILSILVTFLVAWQIWQTIDAKNAIREFDEKTRNYERDIDNKIEGIKEELQRDFNNQESIIYNHILSLFYEHILLQQPFHPKQPLPLYDYLNKAIDGLSLAMRYKDQTTIVALLEQMRNRVERAKNQQLSEVQISDLLEKLRNIQLTDTPDFLVARLQSRLSTFNSPKKSNFDEEFEEEESSTK